MDESQRRGIMFCTHCGTMMGFDSDREGNLKRVCPRGCSVVDDSVDVNYDG